MKQNAKICAIGETECNKKFEVFILGEQRIDQKRKKGWWRGSRVERKETKGTELTIEEEDKEHPLLVLQLPQGTTFLLSSRLDSAVKRCSSEVLFSSGGRLGKVSGPKRLVKYSSQGVR